MGQATSATLSHKKNVFYDYDDVSNRFAKATLSTLAVPMVVIAFPLLNAYTFTEEELTGVKVVDGMIGGLLGVLGWPLAPFLACWSMYEVIFKDGPPEPLPIPPELKEKAKREIDLNCEHYYNVAIVGVAGTGKSSMINGIMGYHDTDEQAAVTGEVESTAKPKGYKHPDLRMMMIWDMPGAGTLNHPRESYFEDKFLMCFDTLIIVTAERLQEIDLTIARKAQTHRIPVLFVRNKADQAVDAKMRRYTNPRNETEAWSMAVGELVQEVRHSIYKQLKANKLSTRRLFILSAWNLQEFVSALSKGEEGRFKDQRLIDEARFIRRLVEGVLAKRNQHSPYRRKSKSKKTNLFGKEEEPMLDI